MNETVVLVAMVAVAGGLVLGFLARGLWAAQSIKAAQEKSARIVAEARTQQKELILQAKDEQVRLQRETEEEARAKRADMSNLERRLLQRDEQLDQRTDMLEERNRKLLGKEQELEAKRDELTNARQDQIAALERVGQMSVEEARSSLLEAVREQADHDAVKLARSIERKAREEAEDRARDVVVTAIQRVMVDHTAEMTVSVVPIPSDEMKGRIIGREGRNIRALEQATGIDLIIDDTPESVLISGFDPVRREVARLALTKLIQDGRIHPGRIEEVVNKATAEVDLIMRQAGEAAAYDTGVPGLPPEMIKLLGRLKYRTSYGQNVLKHVMETARLAAVIAGEVGADVQVAKIGGLLHDIGKAVDHEIEGPHAAIGAQIAQRHNMPMKIVNAIAAHHQEVEYACVEAPIVQIADAISASRPGARGESMDAYVKRLEDLQQIADSFPGVEKSFAVQAGREVRILVRPEEIDDLASMRLARDIVRKIEESLTYPGQIKVTVIRETRAVEYAK
ncbi:MAG: ribonuclease Y [Chloroflexi bacterium]|nr:ribonuclease Y [Chloroflexota bacterium]MBA3850843.1 ribonuclease Y [Chloroflexota bacterium]MDQ3406674.1 ribonuclease Y [Chloroflexota bacterium]